MREALQKLSREGLIQSTRLFGDPVSSINITDNSELYEPRYILRYAIVRMATIGATSAQLDVLDKLAQCNSVYKDRISYSEVQLCNREHHLELAIASGIRRLVEAISKSLDELNRVFHLRLDLKDSFNEIRCEYSDLVNALIRKTPMLQSKMHWHKLHPQSNAYLKP